MSCNDNNNVYRNSCCPDTPYPNVQHESVPSLIDNLVNALYGEITKTVSGGRVVWDIPCDPNFSAEVSTIPRESGEGLLCYLMRVFQNTVGQYSPFQYWAYSGNGSATTFALSPSTNTLRSSYLVYLNGVVQAPTAYTISNTTPVNIVFVTPPSNGVAITIVNLGYQPPGVIQDVTQSDATPTGSSQTQTVGAWLSYILAQLATKLTVPPVPTTGLYQLSANAGVVSWQQFTLLPPVPSTPGQVVLSSAGSNQPASWQSLPSLSIGPVVATGSNWVNNTGGPVTVGGVSYANGATISTPRFVQDRFAERVNVKDFGAVGDGVADDTAAINAAAASLPSGGVLYFPRGIYLKDAGQGGYNNISFIGEDPTNTTIRARARLANTVTVLASTGNNVSLRNLTVDGNWQNLRIYGGVMSLCTLIGDNTIIENCRGINFGGCGAALVESFPFVVAGIDCCIKDTTTSQPVPGVNSVFTASISGTSLVVTSVTSGIITPNVVNQLLFSSGTISAGTRILSQVSGTTGGVGTYTVNVSQNRTSATITQQEQGTYATHINLFGTTDMQPRALTSGSGNTMSIGFQYFKNGDFVRFNSITGGGSPLLTNTTYYVVGVAGSNFQLAATPNGSPIGFSGNIAGSVLGRINYTGTAWIVNCGVSGNYTEGTTTNYGVVGSSYYEGSMGMMAGGAFDGCYYIGNSYTNIGAGFNGDSWNNGSIIIANSHFRNCQRGINITFGVGGGVGSLGVLRRLENCHIVNNTFRTSVNALIGGCAGRFTDVKNIYVKGNYLDTYDGTTGSELAWYFGSDQTPMNVEVYNNVIDSKITFNGNEFGTIQSFTSRENTDENGIQRFEYNSRDRSCYVRGNKTALLNGLELARAVTAAAQCTPRGSAKSATNTFTVYIDAGEYDFNSTTTSMNFNGPSWMSFVGTSDRTSVRIKNSLGTTAAASFQSFGIKWKNLTLVGANGQSALQQIWDSAVVEDCIFDKEGTGTIVPSGSWSMLGTFINCYTEYPFVGSNTQGIFGGKAYNCQFLGGFSNQATGFSLLKDCIIGSRTGTVTSGPFIYGVNNLTLDGCLISHPTGADMQILANCVISNCIFHNVRLWVDGTGNEIYNTVLSLPNYSAAPESIRSGNIYATSVPAALKIFGVGSDKPMNKTSGAGMTVTRLAFLDGIEMYSANGTDWNVDITNDGEVQVSN